MMDSKSGHSTSSLRAFRSCFRWPSSSLLVDSADTCGPSIALLHISSLFLLPLGSCSTPSLSLQAHLHTSAHSRHQHQLHCAVCGRGLGTKLSLHHIPLLSQVIKFLKFCYPSVEGGEKLSHLYNPLFQTGHCTDGPGFGSMGPTVCPPPTITYLVG